MNTNWPTSPLSSLVENGEISYGIVQPGNHVDAGVPIVRVKDVRNGIIDTSTPLRVDPEIARQYGRTTLRGGELLVSIVGTVGETAIVPESMSAWNVARAIAVLRPKRVTADWIRVCLQTPRIRRTLEANLNTTVQATLNLADLKRLSIPVPSLKEREAITSVLGALDDKIATNCRIALLTHELASARFALTLETHPAIRVSIGDLADRGVLRYGDGYRTNRSEHGEPGIRILRAGDIRNMHIFPGPDCVSDEYRTKIGPKVSKPGDIAITTKGTIGRVAVIPQGMEEMVYSPQVCYFRIVEHQTLSLGYLAAWSHSRDLAEQLSTVMHKSDMAPYVNLQDIRSLQVPLPDTSIQHAEGQFQRTMIDEIHGLSAENDVVARTREELLPLLMSGRIRVREAERVVEKVV